MEHSAAEHDHGPCVEIVAAGNEVLLGDVLDTNTNWLCRRVTVMGGRVTREVLVRDEIEAIAAEVRGVLQRAPALAFTVGGLGPTDDDTTLAGLAAGLDRGLAVHPEAERMVREKYTEFAAAGFVPFAEMNEARLKMACLPAGASPVVNPVGGAPGVVTAAGGTTFVSLPGVPEELMAIVNESLDEVFATIFGVAHYDERALVVDLQDESAIADILREVDAASPGVYIKSRAQRMGPEVTIRVTLSARGRDGGEVSGLIVPAMEALAGRLAAAGFAVRPE